MLVDLAGQVSGPLLEDSVDDVLCRRLTSLDRLLKVVETCTRRRGIDTLRRVLDAWDGDTDKAMLAEMRLIRELVARGLPRPVRQFEIWVDGKLIARIDLAFPQWKLGIELDSFRWHAARRAFRTDRQRGNRVAGLGWQLLRATTEDAQDSRELVEAAAAIILATAA
jgi:very-short-patch-repair endonuclease